MHANLIHAAGSKTRVRRESRKVRKLWAPSFHAYVPRGLQGDIKIIIFNFKKIIFKITY